MSLFVVGLYLCNNYWHIVTTFYWIGKQEIHCTCLLEKKLLSIKDGESSVKLVRLILIHKDQLNILQYLCQVCKTSIFFYIKQFACLCHQSFSLYSPPVLYRKDPLWLSIVILMTLPGERNTVLWNCLNSERSSLMLG